MTCVACCQFVPTLGAVRENVLRSLELINDAAARGAGIIVLPELASSGYAFSDAAEARAAAEPLDGFALSSWQDAAEKLGVVIVAGFCETNPDGAPFNSAAIIAPRRNPAVYRKAHLWDRERLIFSAGDAPPPVVDTAFGRISTVICYDLEFPEWVRLPALAGADLLCAPVNWPSIARPAGERPGEVVRVQAQAAMNRIAIAACDRTGEERGVAWASASVIVDADGWPLAMTDPSGNEETTVLAEIDLAASRNKRIAEFSDVFADRRPELYRQTLPPSGPVPRPAPTPPLKARCVPPHKKGH